MANEEMHLCTFRTIMLQWKRKQEIPEYMINIGMTSTSKVRRPFQRIARRTLSTPARCIRRFVDPGQAIVPFAA